MKIKQKQKCEKIIKHKEYKLNLKIIKKHVNIKHKDENLKILLIYLYILKFKKISTLFLFILFFVIF